MTQNERKVIVRAIAALDSECRTLDEHRVAKWFHKNIIYQQ